MSYHKPSTNIIYYYYSKTKIKFSKWESQNLGCGRLTQGVSSSESADSWAQPQWFWLRRSGVTPGVWSFNTDLRLHFAHCYFKGVNTASGKVRGATRNGETTEPTRQREGNSGGLWLPFSSLPRYPTSSPHSFKEQALQRWQQEQPPASCRAADQAMKAAADSWCQTAGWSLWTEEPRFLLTTSELDK